MSAELEQIRAELAELKKLVLEGLAQPDDFVTAEYIARRTGLSAKSIAEGKAGTSSIPRQYFGKLLRFPKREVDRFLADRARDAVTNSPQARARRVAFQLIDGQGKKKRRRA